MKNVKVLIGNYGSGKSELALNFAIRAAARGDRTELLDLDMVNTYFRLTERGKLVEQKEIRLVSPNFACSGIETLSLPAEVSSAFVLDWDSVIFDVGGDDVGATALGRYHQDFVSLEPGALEVLNVVNIRRPLASTPTAPVSPWRTPPAKRSSWTISWPGTRTPLMWERPSPSTCTCTATGIPTSSTV